MLSISKLQLSKETKEYLRVINNKYMKKCVEQKKESILYGQFKQFNI